MGKSKELSEDVRKRIVDLHKSGKSLGAISKELQIPKSSVQSIIRKYDLFGCVSTLPRSGRRPKLSHSDELKLVKMFKDNPGTTKVQIWQELETAGMQVSLSTVKRVLHCVERPKLSSKSSGGSLGAELAKELQQVGVRASAYGGRRKRAVKKLPLSEENIQGRLQFCRKYVDWTAEDWCKVIFSEVSTFQLFTSGKELVRRKGEACQKSCVADPDMVRVWGCFSSKGVGSLTLLTRDTSMNEEWYQNVLQEHLLPTIHEQFDDDKYFFQHDGAPCHKAEAVTKWLKDHEVEVLDLWPENSPDLNPMQNLWSFLKKQVDKQKPTNCDQLQALIRQEWFTINRDLVQKFISSMPERIAEVVRKQGQPCEF
uniref:Paired domain-containing protein n=1 Tax=Cyprinodon variegatus TaxID=28743 RepID=A0A3Q2FGN4_CYPVA